MNTVTTIHLNGRAYQVEQSGSDKLRAYLDKADASLKDNPDKQEILLDLEQAIAEKCQSKLTAHKNVALASEIEMILAEMGPVDGNPEKAESNAQGNAAGADEKKDQKAGAPKRFYQVREGAVISGVCKGIAAYFNIDVVIVRVIFVIITIITHGGFIFGYILLAIFIPHAETPEEKAAAYGTTPLTARDIVDRAKAEYTKWDKKAWKEKRRAWKREWKARARENGAYMRQTVSESAVRYSGIGIAIIGAIVAVITGIWVFAVFSLVTTGLIFGIILLPATIPVWIAVLLLIVLYNFILFPLRAVMYAGRGGWNHTMHGQGMNEGWFGMWEGFMWIAFFAIAGWALYMYVPAAHDFMMRIADWFYELVGGRGSI